MTPLVLPSNQLHRFYAGGSAITSLRGGGNADDHAPEDWVGSTTTVFGETRLGLSALADGTLLTEAITADAEAFLGPEHVAAYGADPAILVKLLHAGERLPVHAHPDRSFAAEHLNCPYGKTEAWIVIGTSGPDPAVYLGFRDDVAPDTLARWVDRQATAEVLGALNRFPVAPGDTVLVPAGTPHAIDEGVFVVELQEPTDFSVLLEWEGYGIDGRADGHLNLGMDLALRCVDHAALDQQLARHYRSGRASPPGVQHGVQPLFPVDAEPFFRAERIRPDPVVELEPGFGILVAVSGAGELTAEAGGALPIRRGQTVLVPHGSGTMTLAGGVELVRCRPPAPEHAPQCIEGVG